MGSVLHLFLPVIVFSLVVGLFYRSGIKRAVLYGVVFAVSQCFIYFAYAASFTYGAYLVTQGLGFQDVFRYTLLIMR